MQDVQAQLQASEAGPTAELLQRHLQAALLSTAQAQRADGIVGAGHSHSSGPGHPAPRDMADPSTGRLGDRARPATSSGTKAAQADPFEPCRVERGTEAPDARTQSFRTRGPLGGPHGRISGWGKGCRVRPNLYPA
jgi:hypothetical protein